MKKLIYTLLLLLVTFPAMAQSLFEQYERFLTEPRTYVCYRPDGKLKIDGKLNESSWKKAAPTAPFVDISGEGFPTPKYETTAKMLWDDEYLYVGAVLQEEDIKARLTQRDTIIYYDNDFEVFIDPDSDGHNYFEIETNARGVIFDLMLGGTPANKFSDYLKVANINEVDKVSNGEQALDNILQSISYLIGEERKILSIASQAGDEVTVSMMSDYLKEQEKLVWMLTAYNSK